MKETSAPKKPQQDDMFKFSVKTKSKTYLEVGDYQIFDHNDHELLIIKKNGDSGLFNKLTFKAHIEKYFNDYKVNTGFV